MASIFLTLLTISRPRFWAYTAGPYLIGHAAGAPWGFWANPWFWLLLMYFLVPANIFIYGINDENDTDTDSYNSKKGSKEYLYKKTPYFAHIVRICGMLGLFIALFLPKASAVFMVLFLAFAYFYSAPPLRFKARPLADAFSNMFYIFPAFVGYYQHALHIPLSVIVGALCWPVAMHLFSAIPDISADAKAHLKTTAVVLGKEASLGVCFLLWLVTATSAILISPYLLFMFFYPFYALYLQFSRFPIQKAYWHFPLYNTLAGLLIFMYTVFTRF